jgi:diguanylate cyclase (GGDEF)-like protein
MAELPLVFAVIDDEPAIRRLLTLIIGSMGDLVVEAGTYAEAQVILREYPWDVALIDRRLPDGDGTDLCREVVAARAPDTHRQVVIISAAGTREDKLEGFEAGADEYIVKPIDPIELRARLRTVRRAAVTQKQLLSRLSALEQISVIDDLTHVYNHRFFNAELRRMTTLANRHGRPLAMMMIDADHFKRVNDVFGHPVGDRVLAEISTLIAQNVRASDVLARYGGEEFAVILPETTMCDALEVAERVREGVADNPIEYDSGQVRITVSIGVAGMPTPSIDTPLALIEAADRALYVAKSEGRNRVKQYEPTREEESDKRSSAAPTDATDTDSVS